MRQLPDEVLYDKRLVDRHIRQGLIKPDDVEARLEKITDREPDSASMDVNGMLAEILQHKAVRLRQREGVAAEGSPGE